MTAAIEMHTVYDLGPFRLDTRARVLTHGGVATPLGARGVAVLAALVSRAGEYVERSVIVDAAWPGAVVEEANLTVQISAIRRVLARAPQGKHWIETLTRRGYRSPKHAAVLPSTVRILRLRHRLFRKSSQSHPRQIQGYLTVSRIAQSLGIKAHWIYDRIHNGKIQVAIDSKTGLYLFPDRPKTMTQFQQLRAGDLQKLRF